MHFENGEVKTEIRLETGEKLESAGEDDENKKLLSGAVSTSLYPSKHGTGTEEHHDISARLTQPDRSLLLFLAAPSRRTY
jgi:hypothetical protein